MITTLAVVTQNINKIWLSLRLNKSVDQGHVRLLVDKDDLIKYQLLISYGLLVRTFSYQPTVDKTIVLSTNC
jgi:hypothetical protein